MRPLQGRSTQYSQRVLFNKVGEMNSCEQDIRNQLRYGRRFVQFARQSEHVQSTPVQRCWPPSLPPPRPGSAEFARLTPDGDRLNKTCPSGAVCSQPSSSLSICRAIIIKPIESTVPIRFWQCEPGTELSMAVSAAAASIRRTSTQPMFSIGLSNTHKCTYIIMYLVPLLLVR